MIAHQVDVILTTTEVGALAAREPIRTIFFAALECELLDRRRFKSQAEAEIAVFDFIEGWYNPQRRHSSLGYLSPMKYEQRHATLS